jgi:hypothetical protein
MWLSLLQAWLYQHFQGMGSKDVWASHWEDWDPRAMLFVPWVGLGTPDNYRNDLDRLDLSGVVMHPYRDHRQACLFERVSIYFGWLRYDSRMLRYLPEQVLRQFERVQTILRHPAENAPPIINLAEIINRFQHALDHALTPEQLGHHAFHGVEVVKGYIKLFYHHSHPHMILPDMLVPVPRPLEREVIDARAAERDGEHGYLQLSGRLSRNGDHVYVEMSIGVVLRVSEEWQHLEATLKEMHDRKDYRRQGIMRVAEVVVEVVAVVHV